MIDEELFNTDDDIVGSGGGHDWYAL